MDANEGKQKVFRDSIKCHRGDYFVTYLPAIWCRPIATVSLTFVDSNYELGNLRKAMEHELEYWLKQYPVPVMVGAFDASDAVILVPSEDGKGYLCGYVDPSNGQICKHWKLMRNDALPPGQIEEKYFAEVYKNIFSRSQEAVRTEAMRKTRASGRAIRIVMLLIVGVPVLIQIVSLGLDWIGYLLSAISITVGLNKLGKAMGWRGLSQREMDKLEKARKMEHCYYHCEKNPEAFNRMKIENFRREAIEDNFKESEEIKKQK